MHCVVFAAFLGLVLSSSCVGIYDIKTATLKGKTKTKNGYVQFKGKQGVSAEFSIDGCDAGEHYIEFLYWTKQKQSNLDLYINDNRVYKDIVFPKTGSPKKTQAAVSMKKLVVFKNILNITNTTIVKVSSTGGKKSPLLKGIQISKAPLYSQLRSCEGVYPAQSGTLYGAKIKGSGVKYNSKTGFIEWNIEACLPGTYKATFLYSQKKDLRGNLPELTANNASTPVTLFSGTNQISTEFSITIGKGLNVIRLSALGSKIDTINAMALAADVLNPFETSITATGLANFASVAGAALTSKAAEIAEQQPTSSVTVVTTTKDFIVAQESFETCVDATFHWTVVATTTLDFADLLTTEIQYDISVQACSGYSQASSINQAALKCDISEGVENTSPFYTITIAVCEPGTISPTEFQPTESPTQQPTGQPTRVQPTGQPTQQPTGQPTEQPSTGK